MTKQALIQPFGGGHYDMQRWVRDGLRDYVTVADLSVGDGKLTIFTEPLIKDLPGIGLAQSVRIRFSGTQAVETLLGKIKLLNSAGENLVVAQESGPNNSLRLFVLEVSNSLAVDAKFEKQGDLPFIIQSSPKSLAKHH